MSEEAARKRPSSRRSATRWTLVSVLVIAVAVAYTVWRPRLWVQDGPSMEPAVADGERFLTLYGAPRLGDLVVVASPSDGATVLKRVVGVAGDTIEIRDGDLWRNGHRVTATAWRPASGVRPAGRVCAREALGAARYDVLRTEAAFANDSTLPAHVPSGAVYVLGDQRDRSNDSRFFGAVATDHVLGRVAWSGHAHRTVRCP